MRRYLLCIFLATAVMSAGCNKSETPENASAEGTVRFLAGMNDREDDWTGHVTRGVALDNTSIHQFGVFCYNTGRTLWATAGATALPNKMYDVPVTRNGSDWAYDPPVKWEGGDGAYFTFMAYSPRATGVYQEPDSPLGNNLKLTTTDATAGAPVLKYSTLDYVPMQIDLLIAAPVYDTYPVDKVPIKFGHALSQIRFKAWSAQDFVRVKRIEISNVKYSATLNLEGVLTPEAGVKTFTLDEINKTLSTDETKMTDLSDGRNAFLLLPQDFTGTTTSTIVVTYTSNGVESSSTPYTIVQNWEKGKSYTYTLKLGGNPTEVMTITGVTVTDWIVDDAEDMETNPAPYKIHPPTEDQYIEINGLKWTTGNLVAVNRKECKVGGAEDDGVYFWFGSLIGHKGGLEKASGGNGNGTGRRVAHGYGSPVWESSDDVWNPDNDLMVWPHNMSGKPTTWESNITTTKSWYFDAGYGYSTTFQDIRDYPGFATGELSDKGVGDPCTFYLGDPWRLPTAAEFLSLTNNKEGGGRYLSWTDIGATYDGNLAYFTDQRLPMTGAGLRSGFGRFGGFMYDLDRKGYYWSSSVNTNEKGCTFHFTKTVGEGVQPYESSNRNTAYPARCVSGKYVVPEPSGSYIPTSVLSAAGWPSDRLPKTGLQVGVRGNKVLPGGTAEAEDEYAQWKTSGTSTSGTSPELGMGKSSTVAMAGTEHPAAEYCRQMGEGWYLPSTKEYQLIYANRALLGADYSFLLRSYYTSTEIDATEARVIMFDTGRTNRASKTNTFCIRCVREI